MCTSKTYQNRNKSWMAECVLSFNMDWWILVNVIPRIEYINEILSKDNKRTIVNKTPKM
jgi:hypothetical protein